MSGTIHDLVKWLELSRENERCLLVGNDMLKSENAKLREQIHLLKHGDTLHVLTDQDLADQQKHEREVQASITALDAENDKLRELCSALYEFAYDEYPDSAELNFADRIRELGIGVD